LGQLDRSLTSNARSEGRTGGRHRVVIVGGGFAGLHAARALRHADVDVTLVDKTNHHLFQPLLYQVATGVLSPGQIAPALRSMFRHQPNARTLLAEVEGFDLARNVVRARAEHAFELPYDSLIVAAGATHSYFGHDNWADIAPGIKSLDDAARVRSRVLGAFELAEQARAGSEREAWLTFVVVGAGPTGVELAGQLAILSRKVLRGEYRTIDPTRARILLIDAGPSALPAFAPRLQQRAAHDLRQLGVELEFGAMAVGVDRGGIEIDAHGQRRRIAARTVIWAAGVRASPLADMLAHASGAVTKRSGQVVVEPDLSLPGHPEVFAIGDMAYVEGVPGLAPAAIQQGGYVARQIRARLRGGQRRPFRYLDKGSIATIGRTRAVAQVGPLKLWGPPAFVIWAVVHLAYLVGWGNRYEAVARWMWTLIARNRRERLISLKGLLR
jgi:NADH:ubiquinone reductase (H+-translocating)